MRSSFVGAQAVGHPSGAAAATRAASAPCASFSSAAAAAASPFSPPFRTVLFASSDFSLPTLRALAPGGCASDLVAGQLTVVTPADKPRGRGRQVQASAFKTEALKLGCRVVDLPADTKFNMHLWEVS